MATTKREELENQAPTSAPLTAQDAILAAKNAGKNTTVAAQEIDERGFVFLPDKRKLIGRPFTIIDAEDNYEALGDYWSMTIRLVVGDKPLFIRDSSKGIRDQVLKIGADRVQLTYWPKGLRVSDYFVGDRPSSTFYLDDTAL